MSISIAFIYVIIGRWIPKLNRFSRITGLIWSYRAATVKQNVVCGRCVTVDDLCRSIECQLFRRWPHPTPFFIATVIIVVRHSGGIGVLRCCQLIYSSFEGLGSSWQVTQYKSPYKHRLIFITLSNSLISIFSIL